MATERRGIVLVSFLTAVVAASACEFWEEVELSPGEATSREFPSPFVTELLAPYPATSDILVFWEVQGGFVHALTREGGLLQRIGGAWHPAAPSADTGVYRAWASPSGMVFAVTQGGLEVYVFDGQSWSVSLDPPGDHYVYDIAGTSSTDVYALVSDLRVYRYDGAVWAAVDGTVKTGRPAVTLWANGPNDIFVAGRTDTVCHYDGVSWEPRAVPLEVVMDIWGGGPGDVWAGGSGPDRARVAHYDGAAWTAIETPVYVYPRTVWGAGPDELYAFYGRNVGLYDGTQWTDLSLGCNQPIRTLWKSTAGRLFAGGDAGTIVERDDRWYPAALSPRTEVNGIWVGGPDGVFVVGECGLAARRSDGGWCAMDSGTNESLFDVWGASAADVYAVGAGGSLVHYDGDVWSVIAKHDQRVYALWGFGPGSLAAASDRDVLLYDGSSWTVLQTGYDERLNDVWGTGPDDVYAVGQDGLVLHYDGAAWRREDTPTNRSLTCIGGAPDGGVFVGGEVGTVLFHDGESWIPANVNVRSGSVTDIAGASSGDVFAIGHNGLVHFDGAVWTDLGSGRGCRVVGVDENGDAYAAGSAGQVLRVYRR